MSLLSNNFLLLTVLVFVAVLLGFEGLYLLWASSHGESARKIDARLHGIAAAVRATPTAHVLARRMHQELPAMQRLLMAMPRLRVVDTFLVQSGLSWSVSRLLGAVAVGALLAILVASAAFHQAPPLVLAAAALGAALPVAYVAWRRKKRLTKIEQQLPEALDLLGRALRAGHAFSSSLKMAGDELAEPIGGELRETHEQVNFGISMPQALMNLSERIPSTDVRYFVVAVLIQRESGGNLTEILGNLSSLVRERLKLQSRVKVLSSEGRLSAWVLTLMPFGLAGLMYAFNPKFMGPLWTDPIGIAMLKYLLTMMAVGVFLLRRITHIHY